MAVNSNYSPPGAPALHTLEVASSAEPVSRYFALAEGHSPSPTDEALSRAWPRRVPAIWQDAPRLRRKLLIAGLVLALTCIAILGVVHLIQSLNDSTITAWRVLLFFVNAFFCVNIVCALCARGGQPRRRSNIGRMRS